MACRVQSVPLFGIFGRGHQIAVVTLVPPRGPPTVGILVAFFQVVANGLVLASVAMLVIPVKLVEFDQARFGVHDFLRADDVCIEFMLCTYTVKLDATFGVLLIVQQVLDSFFLDG